MVQPFIRSPLGGNVGVRTGVFYKLNAAGVPVAGLLELANPFSPNKMGLDVVDSEAASDAWTVTDHALQDATQASSNSFRNLRTMQVSGTLISSIDIPFLGSVGVPGIPGGFGGGLRADLLKAAILRAIAGGREPIMYVSPRDSMPLAFITDITTNWTPDTGENTIITVGLKEARIVSPIDAGGVIQDVAASATGNNASTGLGTQSPTLLQTQTVTPGGAPGVSPAVVPFA